jgi:hypothetical protein
MATVFSMDYQENPGPVLTLIAEAEELSVQSKHTRKQLNKLQAAADTLVEKAVAETMLHNSQFALPTKIDRLFRQRIWELTSRVHLLTFDLMDDEKTPEECSRLESELNAAEQALEHFQLALELDQKLQSDPS